MLRCLLFSPSGSCQPYGIGIANDDAMNESATRGVRMHPSALRFAIPLLGAVAVLGSGCANDTSSSLLTASIGKPAAVPALGTAKSEPLARSARVAATAARAQICGLAF